MSIHTHDPAIRESGLQDDCPRCAEHAKQPWNTLDGPNFRDLIDRTLRNRFGSHQDEAKSEFGWFVAPRSNTEAVAMANTLTMLERFGMFMKTAPESVIRYLDVRWQTDVAKYATPFS